MKISRNTHTASSSSYRSSSKPSKPSSSSSAKPAKSSAAPSKPAKSSSPSKQVKPSLPPSKPQKTNPVPSKPVKKSTNSTLSKTVKKDSNSSKLITTGSGKTTSQSVNNVNVTKTGKVSNDNKKVSGGVKPVVQPNVVQSSKKNHKKDNNTDKKKRPNNGRESNNIVRGNYSITRSKTFSRENNYIKPVTKKFNSQRVLNGSAINIPSYIVPKIKKGEEKFPDIKKVIKFGIRMSKTITRFGQKFGIKKSTEVGFKIGSKGVLTNTGLKLAGKSALSILGKGVLLTVAIEHRQNYKKYDIIDRLKKDQKPKKIGKIIYEKLFKIDKTDTKATDKNEKTVKNDIKTNELNLNTKKLSKVNIAQIDRKLDYLFGKAMGREHNIHRTKSMQISLQHIGVYDNKAGSNALINHFEKVFNDPTSIVETKMKTFTYNELPDKPLGHYISTTRESFFMGPGGGVLFESVWKGNELESVIIKRGKY